MGLLYSAPKAQPRRRQNWPIRPELNRKVAKTKKSPPEKFDPEEPIQAPGGIPGEIGSVVIWFDG